MNHYWEIETNGKPLETVQKILTLLWEDLQTDFMMLPLKKQGKHNWEKETISSAQELSRANPFTPIMIENIAQFVPEFVKKYPGKNLIVLLRPCEIRALHKINETTTLNTENLTVISADCLGTFPEEEYSWRANRKGSQENLERESIRFSSQGGIAPYRYRAACQLCKNPVADQADVNINITGLPIRQKILISALNGYGDKINLHSLHTKIADENTIHHHKATAEKMIYRNEQTLNRLTEGLIKNSHLNIESLIDQLNECGECTTCMNVCPICTTNHFEKNPDGTISREVVADWMVSCVGCGMCEQACHQHKPLAVIFSIINNQLNELNSLSN